jgi:hypothetical protein
VHVETGADVNFELPFTPPRVLGTIGSPWSDIGGSLDTAAGTSSGDFGLTWGITLMQSLFRWGDSVLLNGSFGDALRGGYTNNAPPDRKKLGSTLVRPGRPRTRLPADAQPERLGASPLHVERGLRRTQSRSH